MRLLLSYAVPTEFIFYEDEPAIVMSTWDDVNWAHGPFPKNSFNIACFHGIFQNDETKRFQDTTLFVTALRDKSFKSYILATSKNFAYIKDAQFLYVKKIYLLNWSFTLFFWNILVTKLSKKMHSCQVSRINREAHGFGKIFRVSHELDNSQGFSWNTRFFLKEIPKLHRYAVLYIPRLLSVLSIFVNIAFRCC